MKEPPDLKSRTREYALASIQIVNNLENNRAGRVIGNQLIRSATSVGANYREAVRSRSDAEFISKFGDCLKELEETSSWLELCTGAKLGDQTKLDLLARETNELIAIFTAISKKLKARHKAN